jgi:Holliday junction resolvasome RuvABC endonuclease subunit
MQMKLVLGFDISSSTIGYSLLEIDDITNKITFKYADYIKPIKDGTIIERLVDTRDKINTIIVKANPDYIAIEDIIQFMSGASTAKTIIMLTAFNRMIGLTAYDYLHRSPELFNVMTIRHGLKLNKDLPKKEDMAELVSKHLGITFPYRLNKKGKTIIENEDMADGIAVALYYSMILTGKIIRKITKVKAVKRKVKK